jgi:hypothetical protein
MGLPNRFLWALSGVVLGTLVASALRWPRPWLTLVACILAGCILGGAVSYAMRARYTATANLLFEPPLNTKRWYSTLPVETVADRVNRVAARLLSDESLAKLIQHPALNLYPEQRTRLPITQIVRTMRDHDLRIGLEPHSVARISFTYRDPVIAQRVVAELGNQAIEGELFRLQRLARTYGEEFTFMARRQLGERVTYLDAPSRSETPVWPNRPAMAAAGAGVGLLAGIIGIIAPRWRGPSITAVQANVA